MALQNRVTPFGEIVAQPARGTLMGNRGGCLHRPDQTLGRRRWVSERWITCLLEFRGWHREVMQPGRYTELFFLDEATALAAGHRPCALCRRTDFEHFRKAWVAGNPAANLQPTSSISAIDRVLHGERCGPGGAKVTFRAKLGDLPRGTIVALDAGAALWQEGRLFTWSFEGYGAGTPADPGRSVDVLTPRSTVGALAAGYLAGVHPSAVVEAVEQKYQE
jgi:hypothetical protein